MGKKKTSILWKIHRTELEQIVKNNTTLIGILRHFDLQSGNNIKTLKQRLIKDDIDYSHIPLGRNSNKGRKFPRESKPLVKVMIRNSTYSRGHLKKRLLKKGLLENKCSSCGQLPLWDNKKLVMVLDHINGINNDHRKENLRLLCPNCNSQTKTFAGKRHKIRYHCKKCGKNISRDADLCVNCSGFNKRMVVQRPIKEQLLKEVKELGYCGTGRKYGVSDNSIRKWLKS